MTRFVLMLNTSVTVLWLVLVVGDQVVNRAVVDEWRTAIYIPNPDRHISSATYVYGFRYYAPQVAPIYLQVSDPSASSTGSSGPRDTSRTARGRTACRYGRPFSKITAPIPTISYLNYTADLHRSICGTTLSTLYLLFKGDGRVVGRRMVYV